MLNYLIFLILGGLAGYFFANDTFTKIKNVLMPVSVIVLLFFMGVSIGKDSNLSVKIVNFGINAFIIALFSIVFSVFFVFIFVKILKKII